MTNAYMCRRTFYGLQVALFLAVGAIRMLRTVYQTGADY